MPASDAAGLLTAQHTRRQQALRALTVRDLLALARGWDGQPQSFGPLALAVMAMIELRRRTSSGLAAQYFQGFRLAEGVAGEAVPVLAGRLDPLRLRTAVYASGLGSTDRALKAGKSLAEARRVALVNLSGEATRHVLDGGRETLISSVRRDARARGWQRVTGGKPCAFCMTIASRGPVFKEDTVGFRAHGHCACSAEPVYGGGWSGSNLRHRKTYDEATAGLSGPDAINALRRHLAGA